MNKSLLVSLLRVSAVFYGGMNYAQEYCSNVKARVGAFIPQAKLFRDIYGSVGPVVELEVATQIGEHEHLQAWANINGFFKEGHSLGLCSPTKMGMMRVSFGLKFPYVLSDCWTVYGGVGPSFAGVWLRNHSPFTWEKVAKGSAGLVLKSGVSYFPTERIFVDFFADYAYQPTHFKPNHVNTGGANIGIGLGGTF